MSDLDLTKKTSFTQDQNPDSSQNLKDQVADAGADLKQRAGEAFRASADVARDTFREAADAAKDAASGTMDEVQSQAREKQQSGADFIKRFADNIREAARAFEGDSPFAARGINSAADYVEDAAENIRNGSVRDLIDGATDFAKRQPAAFLGASVLAGFAVVRFLKASGEPSSPSNSEMTAWPSAEGSGTWSGTSSGTRPPSRPGTRPQQTSSFARGSQP
jgi:gas vesicle protein